MVKIRQCHLPVSAGWRPRTPRCLMQLCRPTADTPSWGRVLLRTYMSNWGGREGEGEGICVAYTLWRNLPCGWQADGKALAGAADAEVNSTP